MKPGDRLGSYEILAPVGAGGMGEVYKARDTRLDRIVAIKVSKTEFSDRFEREARAIAILNHPHICQLYDVGPNYLVMEFIDGVPLKGPLPLDQTLKFAAQICDALDAAHKKNITHRDLKPANILVTKTGVKLLDFGLAKVGTPLDAGEGTMTMALTGKGEILGTFQYMSPEQINGQEVGPQSDIFSFGLVLYEMLTGKRAFDGSTPASVIAAILERPAPSVADVAPPALDRVLKQSLEKDPESRWQSARDLKLELEWIGNAPESGEPPSPSRLGWTAAAVLGLILIVVGALLWRATRPVEEPRVLKVSVLPPEEMTLLGDIPAVSPDGRRVAFAASRDGNTSLWVRDLGSLEARPLPGTDGGHLPFWSPDSRSLGFFANGKLKRTDAAGGSVLNLCDAPFGGGGTWNRNDVIVFSPGFISALFRVPAAGGTPVQVTTLSEQEPSHNYPWFLPDGRHFLYTPSYGRDRTKSLMVYVQDLDTKNRHALIAASSNVIYASGYLLFQKDLTLMAQPFDVGKLQITGDAVPVAEQVGYSAINTLGFFSASQNGVLVYDSPALSAFGAPAGNSQLTWFDRSGKITGTVGPPGALSKVALASNDNWVATSRADPQTGVADIWLYDLVRGTNSRFTLNALVNLDPVWSPDNNHITFFSDGGAVDGVHRKATNGAEQDEVLEGSRPILVPTDWSSDGRYIIERTGFDAKTAAIWVLPLFGDKKPFPYLQTDANESWARLSPNGHWLAYQSDETKRNEIYVGTFPQPGEKLQISANGGSYPVWSRDGKELYYMAKDTTMMAVEVKAGPNFDAGVPKPLFKTHAVETNYGPSYDVNGDGRFLILVPPEQGGGTAPINVVINWTVGLKK